MINLSNIKIKNFKSTKYITDNIENLKFDFHIFMKKDKN